MTKRNDVVRTRPGKRRVKTKSRSVATRSRRPKLFDSSAADDRELQRQLKSMGLYAAHTLGDGNCLFRALSDQYHGTPGYHSNVRTLVCDFMEKNAHLYEMFVGAEQESDDDAPASDMFKKHVREMRIDGTYGAHLEIQAWASLVLCDIKIIQPNLVYIVAPQDKKMTGNSRERVPPRLISKTPSAREERKRKRDTRMALQSGDYVDDSLTPPSQSSLPDSTAEFDPNPLYVVYHDWEHYSSARNISGPHTGLPNIHEIEDGIKSPTSSFDTSSLSPSRDDSPVEANEEENLVLSSLRFPEKHSILTIRRLIKEKGGWEDALEELIDRENSLDDAGASSATALDAAPRQASQSSPGSSSPSQRRGDEAPVQSPTPSVPTSSPTPLEQSTATSPWTSSDTTQPLEDTRDRFEGQGEGSTRPSKRAQRVKGKTSAQTPKLKRQAQKAKPVKALQKNENLNPTFRELHI